MFAGGSRRGENRRPADEGSTGAPAALVDSSAVAVLVAPGDAPPKIVRAWDRAIARLLERPFTRD